jgi:hypothetical protein
MSSISSNTSTIVNFRDEQIELDDALNSLYGDIQHNLNHSQCAVRQLAASSEQDDDFLVAAAIHFEINDYVDILTDLFIELKTVSKQCLGPIPNDCKIEYKKLCDDRKEKKKQDKLDLKAMQQQMKLNSVKE